MKKSWHPQLLKNQEEVWLREKNALEERKKLDQLRKEREEERQVQELQRLQEEKTGKKRVEKLDWLYATPASGNGPNASEMEDYLLGKKRVDKILIADENAKLGASHKNFIAVQNANTARDVAAKVREDPLFAIMQQQQAAMQSLKDNPLRLRELQKQTGIALKEKDKEKKAKRRHEGDHHSEKRRKHHHDSDRDHRHRRGRSHTLSPREDGHHVRSSRRSRSRSPKRTPRSSRRHDSRTPPRASGRNHSPGPSYRNGRSPDHRRSRHYEADAGDRRRSPPINGSRRRSPPPSHSRRGYDESERQARLAAMTSDANTMEVDRAERLATLEAQDKAQLEIEEAERRRNARDGIQGSFISVHQKHAMEMNLGDKMKQGHRGYVKQRD